jgi:hypothetical protein
VASGEPLGGHVGKSADHGTGLREPGVRRLISSDAEIDQVDELAGHQQDVRRLDVAVYQAMRMGRVKCGSDLLDNLHRQLGAHRPVGFQQRLQIDAVDNRHHQIQPSVDLAGVVDRNDVGFVQAGDGVRLALEPRAIAWLVHQIAGQHLDRHVPADCRVVGPVHLAHSAFANQPEQLVAPKEFLIHWRTALTRSEC